MKPDIRPVTGYKKGRMYVCTYVLKIVLKNCQSFQLKHDTLPLEPIILILDLYLDLNTHFLNN